MTPQQQRAYASVTELMGFGWTETGIAAAVEVATPTIFRIYTMPRHLYWKVSEKLAAKLEELVITTRKTCLEKILLHMPRGPIETANNTDMMVDATVAEKIRDAIRTTFIACVEPQAPPVPLPAGIAAALESVTPDLIVIKLMPHHSQTDQVLLIIHELEHLLERLKTKLPPPRPPKPPEAAY